MKVGVKVKVKATIPWHHESTDVLGTVVGLALLFTSTAHYHSPAPKLVVNTLHLPRYLALCSNWHVSSSALHRRPVADAASPKSTANAVYPFKEFITHVKAYCNLYVEPFNEFDEDMM